MRHGTPDPRDAGLALQRTIPIEKKRAAPKRTPLPRATKPIRKESPKDVKVVIRKITDVFNFAIRMRDTILNEESGARWGRCVSCGKPKDFAKLQAGHFLRAIHWATKWHVRNVHAQCIHCNNPEHGLGGNVAEYRKEIAKRYGEEEITRLEQVHRTGHQPNLHAAILKLEQVEAWADRMGWSRKHFKAGK